MIDGKGMTSSYPFLRTKAIAGVCVSKSCCAFSCLIKQRTQIFKKDWTKDFPFDIMIHADHANVAQSVEQLIRNQQVRGSSPLIGSTIYRGVAQFGSAFGSGPKGRRFKSCHLDQKMPESERIPVLFLFILHKAPSLVLFSCNGCATLGKGPKTLYNVTVK